MLAVWGVGIYYYAIDIVYPSFYSVSESPPPSLSPPLHYFIFLAIATVAWARGYSYCDSSPMQMIVIAPPPSVLIPPLMQQQIFQ